MVNYTSIGRTERQMPTARCGPAKFLWRCASSADPDSVPTPTERRPRAPHNAAAGKRKAEPRSDETAMKAEPRPHETAVEAVPAAVPAAAPAASPMALGIGDARNAERKHQGSARSKQSLPHDNP